MHMVLRSLLVAAALALGAVSADAAETAPKHRIVIQVSQNDPERMNLALGNTANVIKYFSGKGESVAVEIVAYGPGLNMLRADTSPVKDRIASLKASSLGGEVRFSACHNTQQAMAKREGHPIEIIPEATVVPSGVVRLMQLEEQGWSYVRP
jgi:hypothetical protein